MDLTGVGPVLTLLGTFGGVWAVVLVFRWLQRDFVKTYRDELAEVRKALEVAEHERDAERRARWHAEDVAARYRLRLIELGQAPEEG